MPNPILEALDATRKRAWHEQKAVADRAVAEKRLPTAEEQAIIDRTDKEIDEAAEQIKSWQDREIRDQEFEKAREAYAPFLRDDSDKRPDREFEGLVDFLRGERRGNADNGKAWEIDIRAVAKEKNALRLGAVGSDLLAQMLRSDAKLRNALSPDSAAAGGNLIPTDFVRRLYDYLEVFTGMRRANVTVLTTTEGNPLEFPKVVSGGTAAIVGAGTAVAGTDPTFGKMTLNAWKYGELVRVPNELLTDSGVDLEGFLARDFGRAIGRASNTHYTTGTGTNQPEGLMTVIGTAVTGANGGTGQPSFDDLIDLEYAINSEYAMNAEWMMRRATIGRVRKLKNTQNEYLWQPSNIVGQPDLLDGYPIRENPAMAAVGTAALSIAFGDFSAFYIRDVGSIRVARSDDRYFDTDEVAWRATLRTDSGLIDLTGAVLAYRGGTA